MLSLAMDNRSSYGRTLNIWPGGGGGALTCLHSGGQHGFPSVFMLSSKMEMWPQFVSSPNEIPFPPVLVAGQKSVLLQRRSPSLPTDRRPISLPTCSLACRLPPSESQVPSSSRLPPAQTSSFSLSLLPCYFDYSLSWSFLRLFLSLPCPALPSVPVSPGHA